MKFRIGDHVQYSFLGKVGDSGTVLHVTKKRGHATGGSRYHVKVRWDSNKHEGSFEDRALVLLHRPFKGCGCGRTFTKQEWKELRFVGFHPSETAKLKFNLELRNCPCGSTIAIERRERKAAA